MEGGGAMGGYKLHLHLWHISSKTFFLLSISEMCSLWSMLSCLLCLANDDVHPIAWLP